jgi:SulP family sulfate permease
VTAVLLNATGMELATKTDIDFDRELKSAGIANLVSGLGGGMVCFQAISLSVLARKLGASRLAGIVVAVLCGIALYYGPSFLPFIPKFVLGGVLIYLGASLLVEWLIDARHTLSTMDHLLVVLILTVIATVGFLEGIALGMALAIFLFAFNLSRTSIVKQALSGADQRSSVQRSGRDTRIIDRLGDRIWILELQGYMFFGTANSLLEHARQHLTDQGPRPAKFIVLDFRQLIGIDSSAAFSLRRLEQVADSKGATLIFSHLSRSLSSQLISNGVAAGSDHRFMTFHDLDHALEWCEDQLLGTQEAGRHSKDRPLEDHLKRLLPPTIAVTDLLGYMEKKDFAAGQILVREGDAAEKLYFLQSGRVSVRLKTGDRRTIRLRTMNAGSTVGEIGLYLDRLRSATVVAENPTTVYQLSKDDLIAMEDRHPEVASAFHKLMVVTEAERLVSLNRLLVALRR